MSPFLPTAATSARRIDLHQLVLAVEHRRRRARRDRRTSSAIELVGSGPTGRRTSVSDAGQRSRRAADRLGSPRRFAATALLGDPAGVGQQRHLAGVLDRQGDLRLLLGVVAGDASGADLGPVGHEPAEQVDVLVVDVLDAAPG